MNGEKKIFDRVKAVGLKENQRCVERHYRINTKELCQVIERALAEDFQYQEQLNWKSH